MQPRKLFTLASCFTVLGLFAASCAPGAASTPATRPTAPAPKVESPVAKPTAAPAAPSPTAKPAAEEPRYGGILNISHPADPGNYDPIQATSIETVGLVGPCYSGIVQHDPLEPTRVIGDLAETWDMSADGLVFTFHLYKNVKWHDGTPFTSEDARFSLETVRKPPRGVTSPRQEWLKAVDKLEAPDKDTLKMTLQYPSGAFLHNLADGRMLVVPRKVFESKGSMKRDIVGTGPYKFKSHNAGISFTVAKNPDYFMRGRPFLDGIMWYIVTDSATRFAALRTHRVAVTPSGSQGLIPSQSEIVQKEMSDKIIVDRYPSVTFVSFYMPLNKPPWNDIRVRRAVDLTINRPNLVKVALEGVGEVGAFMPPGLWGLPQNELMSMPGYRQSKDADIAEAKRLLAEAGYPQGLKTTTLARNSAQHERTAVALKEQLAEIRIDITPKLHPLATATELLMNRNFDTAAHANSASFDDPDQLFGQAFVSGVPRNFSDFSDEKIDKWYDEQARALDPAKRKQIVLDMQRRMFELIPCSVLYWSLYQSGRWEEVRNLRAGIGNYNNLKFQDVWLAR